MPSGRDKKSKDNKSSYIGDPGQKRFKKQLDQAGDIDIKPQHDPHDEAFSTGSRRKLKKRIVYG